MIRLRPGGERGHTRLGWLDSRHSFSFDHYYDPNFMGFRHLRVLNEDFIAPGRGFGAHPHRDMEIVTYVLEGSLEHKDSMGNGSVIRPGEVQRMSAGTGVTHSEHNHSPSEPVHLFQVWILPRRQGIQPSYEQRAFPMEQARGALLLLAAGDQGGKDEAGEAKEGRVGKGRDGRNGFVTLHQDADLYVARLSAGQRVTHRLRPGRHAWVQTARGAVALNGSSFQVGLQAGDGAAISTEAGKEELLELSAGKENDGNGEAEILLFDLS
ncbi:MAG: pirin family protein [Acidobacteria bacterium]|nr:pirin family protein [Acidobacteriota bacterium]MCZ6752282.1 pirin family protein [Acidobacteriota bacterium]